MKNGSFNIQDKTVFYSCKREASRSIKRGKDYNICGLSISFVKTIIILFLVFILFFNICYAEEESFEDTEEVTEIESVENVEEEIENSVEVIEPVSPISSADDTLLLLVHINYVQSALILVIILYMFLHNMLERRKV